MYSLADDALIAITQQQFVNYLKCTENLW